jgi:hypothetical protein
MELMNLFLKTSPLASECIGLLNKVLKIIASKNESGWLQAISKGPPLHKILLSLILR